MLKIVFVLCNSLLVQNLFLLELVEEVVLLVELGLEQAGLGN